ncbi:hypothetical protein BT93_G0511 [Corymbia citriodora subsp. variegata]|nr:hypothetical protein BT93_G0511 [Corymbia citriodora subsp. variegata]
MALTLTKLLLFSFLFISTVLTAKSQLSTSKQKNLTRFHVYAQDKNTAPNATIVNVAQASTTNQSATSFGLVKVADDPLTEGPEMSSKNLGRLQGMVTSASQSEVAVLMSINFVFTEGKYNGSSLTVVGRNELFLEVRELSIVGGTGLFRLARGYVLTSTYSADLNTGALVLLYDFFVYHY